MLSQFQYIFCVFSFGVCCCKQYKISDDNSEDDFHDNYFGEQRSSMEEEFLDDVEVCDFDVKYQFDLTNTPITAEGIRRTGADDESAMSFSSSSTVSKASEAVEVGMDEEEEEKKQKVSAEAQIGLLAALHRVMPEVNINDFLDASGAPNENLTKSLQGMLLGASEQARLDGTAS